jgi:hypothetical protein
MRGKPKPIIAGVRRYAADRETWYRQKPDNGIDEE